MHLHLHEQWVLFALTEMEAWVWTAELNTLDYVFPKARHVTAIVPQCRELYKRCGARCAPSPSMRT